MEVDDRQAELIQLMRDHNFGESLKQLKSLPVDTVQKYCWELLPLAISAIDEFQLKSDSHTDEASDDTFNNKLVDELISTVRAGTTPKELLVMCIETLHSVKSGYAFELTLELIGDCLQKQAKYPKASLIWSMEVVSSCLSALPPPPEEPNLENAEQRKLMDLAPETRDITERYRVALRFLKSQLAFTGVLKSFSDRDRRQLCAHLARPLATTLGQLDISPEKAEGKSPSAQHVHAVELVAVIERILVDPVAVFELAEGRRVKLASGNKKDVDGGDGGDGGDDDDDELKIDPLSTAVLAYMVFCLRQSFPRVYSPTFLADLLLPLSARLLASQAQLHTLKGLALFDETFVYVGCVQQGDPLQTASLRLLKVLFDVMTSCPLDEARRHALDCWKRLYAKFDPRFQQRTLHVLFGAVQNPSARGFILDMSRHHLAKHKQGDGNLLFQRYVFMPEKETTDLLHHSEYLLASLAYVRHLCLNGMIDKSPELASYLEQFKRALVLSRAHYDLNLNESNATNDITCSVMPNTPLDVKKSVLEQAHTRFDLMESLLAILQSWYDSA